MTKNMKKILSVGLSWALGLAMMLSGFAAVIPAHACQWYFDPSECDGADTSTPAGAGTSQATLDNGTSDPGTSSSCDFAGGCAQYDPNAPQLPAGFAYNGLRGSGGYQIASSGSQGSVKILLYRDDYSGNYVPEAVSQGFIGTGLEHNFSFSPDGTGPNPELYGDGNLKIFDASGKPVTLQFGQLLPVTNTSTGAHGPAASINIPTTIFGPFPGASASPGNTANAGNTTSNGQNPTTSTCTNCGGGSSNSTASNPGAANQLGVAGPSGALGAGTGGANSGTGAGTGGSNSFSSGGAGSGSGTINNPLGSSATNLTQLILRVTDAATSFLLIISVIFFLWTGLQFLLAQGNETKIQDAKRAFWNTVIGTGVVLAAKLIVQIISNTISKIDPSIHSSF